MIIKETFPFDVQEIKNLRISLSDGKLLTARAWIPLLAYEKPVPAILEYIPYRQHDGTVEVDALMHPYFAGHGYACLRVDIRGSGNSEGLLYDEYLKQEQDDVLEVWGDGSQVRDFVYVDDVVDAYLKVFKKSCSTSLNVSLISPKKFVTL